MELIHGGDWAGYRARFGHDALDFSANVSPLGLPQGVADAIVAALPTADRYPDPLCRELRTALSRAEQLPEPWILCGNGAADLIYRLVWALKPRRALLRAALVGHIVPHVRPCREGQPEAGFHLRSQRVELLGGQRGEGFPRKGAGLADIAQRRDEGRTELVSQRLPALLGEEDEVLAAGGDAAHRPGGKGGPGVHQNALLVDEIPAGQGRTAPDGEVGQRL